MQQYWEIKSAHQDKILLFRMGDFYEMFHEDAVIAAPILGIALTSRNKKSSDYTPMCGVPHHSIQGPISKLLSAGYKVAICDQIEDPAQAKGIVKRAVTRILSPGMVFDFDQLEATQGHYLTAMSESHIAFLDASSAEAFYFEISSVPEGLRLGQVLRPREVVMTESDDGADLASLEAHRTLFRQEDRERTREKHRELLSRHSLPEPCLRLLLYVLYMQGEEFLKNFRGFDRRESQARMLLNLKTLRHLEIFETNRGESRGSLFMALNRTKTSFGARLLRQWLAFPLTSIADIQKRHMAVEAWMRKPEELKALREQLGRMGDVERRVVRISSPGANAADLRSLVTTLEVGLEIAAQLRWSQEKLLSSVARLVQKIKTTIVEEPPLSVRDGGMIQKGVDVRLDEYIDLTTNSQDQLLAYEAREKERTGISSLKVRYNQVFGYYIEITHTHREKVPADYLRKQTLVNAERFTTEELQALERKILSARTQRVELEHSLFQELRAEVLSFAPEVLDLAHQWAELDVHLSQAWLAIERNYCRPQFTAGGELHVEASRHPVVEQMMADFVPNSLDMRAGECLLLTGPNMAGKSTLMRQVALLSMMAQAGGFVPAANAKLPLFHKILTRIGASDSLSEGLSTFMVEMTETAEMLREADAKSLIVLDEIGRGTSTYDGMALAQAILEYIVSHCKSLSLFATHYHELTEMEKSWAGIRNAHMRIKERDGHIQFLHTLAWGAAGRSYGIQVAEKAGLPSGIITRAQAILGELTTSQGQASPQLSLLGWSEPQPEHLRQEMEDGFKKERQNLEMVEKFKKELSALEVNKMTPLEALNWLSQKQSEQSQNLN